ncbi:MAG: hypothetical protein AAGJ08_16865 [Cyanobacteria bacterium P01_H01_bin.35]
MSKYIVSIILVSSVLTGVSIIPAITNNFTAQEKLQFDGQKQLQLIAQADDEADPGEEGNIRPGESRDSR